MSPDQLPTSRSIASYPECFGEFVDLVDSSNNWRGVCDHCEVKDECFHLSFMEDVPDDS